MAWIVCPLCKRQCEKPSGAVNRARKVGMAIYCSRWCSGAAKRVFKAAGQKKEEKRVYDAAHRKAIALRLKAEKAEYHKRTYDPAKAAVKRKARMPYHVEYCRKPEYKEKKSLYDLKIRAAEYGEFADAYLLLLSTERGIKQRMTKYEIYQTNGTLGKTQRRKRAAAHGTVALG